ncbi:hypothetical protein DW150_04165 [Phocaeicola vulgatus]|uniref:Uncharacterized protein n=1 Tax=Phocaeicola vulgatus TaxID=821 RepID=A0A415BUK5_PHOVU|nr:hypothetical protein DW150_04165 [Phocaeicola vulgatus]
MLNSSRHHITFEKFLLFTQAPLFRAYKELEGVFHSNVENKSCLLPLEEEKRVLKEKNGTLDKFIIVQNRFHGLINEMQLWFTRTLRIRQCICMHKPVRTYV